MTTNSLPHSQSPETSDFVTPSLIPSGVTNHVINGQRVSPHDPPPPYTNRGVDDSHKSQTEVVFSLDWVRLTVHTDLAGITPFLIILGVANDLVDMGHGGTGYKRILAGLNGFQLYCEPVNEGENHVSVNIPSNALKTIGVDKLHKAAYWLCEQGLKGQRWGCTRLDLAFDSQGFSVEDFASAWRDKAVDTKTRAWNEIKGSDGSHTFYVGSRESTAMARVYHKMDGSSFGPEAFTRVELELKAERAAMAFFEIMAAPMKAWSQMAAQLLQGFMTVRTGWWLNLVNGARRAWLRLKQNIPTVDTVGRWLYKQVLPGLALYLGAVNGDDPKKMLSQAWDMICRGEQRLNDRQNIMKRNYQADTTPQWVAAS